MVLDDGNFVCHLEIPLTTLDYYKDNPDAWMHIKHQLEYKFFEDVFVNFINGGWYSFNLAFLKEEYPHDWRSIRYGIFGKIYKVQERQMYIAKIEEPKFEIVIPKEWKLLCSACGNIFTPDSRGGCSACGAPANWSIK